MGKDDEPTTDEAEVAEDPEVDDLELEADDVENVKGGSSVGGVGGGYRPPK